VQGRGHGERAQVADRSICAVVLLEAAILEQHPDRLHGVERDSLGARHDLLDGWLGQARHQAGEDLPDHRVWEWLKIKARKAALAGTPVRATLEQLGPRQGDDVDGVAAAPLEHVVDEVELPRVCPVQILEYEDSRIVARNTLEERAPGRKQVVTHARVGIGHAQQLLEPWPYPTPLGLVRDVVFECTGQLGAGGGGIVQLQQADTAADHLGKGPEADPFAVGGRAALVPEHVHGDAVDVFQEFPSQPALADPRLADDREQSWPLLPRRRVEQVLDQAHLGITAHEWRFELVGAADAATLGHDAQGPVGGDRADLALQLLLAHRLEHDRALGALASRLADDHRPWRGYRLQPGSSVDQVTCDHPLVRSADGHCGLPCQDAGTRHQGGAVSPEVTNRVDEFQRRPNRSLCVILVRDRRAPHRHHRVADELLDRSSVPGDDLLRHTEILSQLFADSLGVARLGDRREANEVREQHRHQLSFGNGAGIRDLRWADSRGGGRCR
jgi:hypothetical protein